MVNPPDKARNNYVSTFRMEVPKDKSERTDDSIECLLPLLNFHETPELIEARQAVLMALSEAADGPSRLRDAWIEYSVITEQIVDNFEITGQDVVSRAKAQLSVVVHKALIFLEAGRTDRYIGELDYAETIASANKFKAKEFNDAALKLRDELNSATSTADLSPESLIAKLWDDMSEMNRDYLRHELEDGSDLEELINYTYDILMREGHNNPEKVFVKLGILPPKA
ncbi:hypothetical protein H7X68_03170 [Candidatus Saccharibacteria bacterium]|nr:hypothetical protein [Candidatus Saccharibacteria bacterium]